MGDFDLKALHTALDEQRRARGLTWAETTREISARNRVSRTRPVASSTITGLRTKRLAEADGVLQMLRWLGRAPESFVASHAATEIMAAPLPDAGAGEVLRVDTRKLFEALDAKRTTLERTWDQVAVETGVPATHMRGLARGGRTAFPGVTRLTMWLKQPMAEFVRRSLY